MNTRNYREHLPYGPLTEQTTRVLARLEREQKRTYKTIAYNQEWTPENRKHERYRWVENPEDGLRLVGKVHDICRREGWRTVDNTGWYVDNFQSETTCGLVFRLPAKNGQCQYVPACSDPWTDGAVVDFRSVTDDLHDAIRWADSMAEWYAEDCRESEAKQMAEDRITDIKDEIKQERADLKDLIRELKRSCDTLTGLDAIKAAIREAAESKREHIHSLRRQIAKLQDNYWEVVY